jgi:hypothetical protein
MAEIGRPPLLRIRHQRVEVLLESLEVELLKFFRIIKPLAHRIRERGVLMQHLQVDLIRPPVAIGLRLRAGMHVSERALAPAGFGMRVHDTTKTQEPLFAKAISPEDANLPRP